MKFKLIIVLLLPILMYSQPRNMILYIGDGFGIAPKTATRMALGQGQDNKRYSTDADFKILALDKLKYQATATTHSMNSWITDSAPGASVYACGKEGKIDNEVISFNPATNLPIITILEQAKKAGYAVGLITTTRITHATPAAFASHIWHRELEDYIAAQLLSSSQKEYEEFFSFNTLLGYNPIRDWQLPEPKIGIQVDVLLGGGAKHFLPANANYLKHDTIVGYKNNPILDSNGMVQLVVKRDGKTGRKDQADGISLAKKRGYVYINSRDALLNIDLNQFTESNNIKLLGLFNASHLSYEQDRQLYKPWEPALADMVEIATKILKRKSKKGFFLMVEGGRIDHLEHANAGMKSHDCHISTILTDSTANPESFLGNNADIYGSDYIIKEVLAFDYAIEVGRNWLLDSKNGQTLLAATSDHECGGTATVALHDEEDKNKNGSKVRTYADEIRKNGQFPIGANPKDGTILRGDGGSLGWFPQYKMYQFQNRMYPKPVSNTAKRIVISYASNPHTNGNNAQQASGNHTPQDIMMYTDDNMEGIFAKKITGRGLLDNTDLYPLMLDFLKISK